MQLTSQQDECLDHDWHGLLPEKRLDVSEWADKHRKLSDRESPEPGRWRTSRVPYLKEPMDCLSSSSPIQEVVLMFGAQLGKTETGNNWTGYNIDHSPGSMLAVQPTVEIGKRFSKQRLAPMISATPRLSEKIADSRSRDSGNTTLSKEFPGGMLIITGANSAAGLRSMPIKYLFGDEIDAYPEDCDGEGEPCDLAKARTRNFARKKILWTSTPTFANRSRIEGKYLEGDQRQYHVPCPHCEEKNTFKFRNLCCNDKDPSTVYYLCEGCGKEIEEHHKTWMLENGDWIATAPGNGGGKIASFHLTSLYSPLGWFSWVEIMEEWFKAYKKPDKLRVFTNTILAETWKEKGEAPDWKKLYDRRETYEINTIPDQKILFLTAGVDVQKDRIEVEVLGWSRHKESWSIDYRVFPNNEDGTYAWQELDSMLTEEWVHPSGMGIGISRLGLDTSYDTQTCYGWARTHPLTKVLALKGSDTSSVLIGHPKAMDVTIDGKTVTRGIKLWSAGVSVAKGEIYGWLNQEAPTEESGNPYPTGFCHIPQYDEEYFKQLCAEQIVVRIVKGYRRYEWEKTRERNETLDTRVYARIAAHSFGLDRFKDDRWNQMEDDLGVTNAPKKSIKPKSKAKTKEVIKEKHGVKFRRGNFLNKRR